MEKTNSVSFETLMKKINPLNLRDSYNDNVVALKILLNLSDNNEVRNLGQQIVDSFLLLNLLNTYKKIKEYIPEYKILCDKLYTFINKYSQFEKLLRKSAVNTQAYLSIKYSIDKNIENIGDECSRAIDSETSYIVMNKDNSKNYSLNEILDSTDLFRIVLCKDKNFKFKEDLSTKNVFNISYSEETQSLMKRKKNSLVKTIVTNDDLTDSETELFQIITDNFKTLIELEQEIYILESVIDKMMSQLFVLDSNISGIYRNFKELCEQKYREAIKKRIVLTDKLNLNLSTYESLLDTSTNKIEYDELINRINAKSNSTIVTDVFLLYKRYIMEKENKNNIMDVSFFKYVEQVAPEKLEMIHSVEGLLKNLYSEYLIEKIGNLDSEDIDTFDKFVEQKYSTTDKKI